MAEKIKIGDWIESGYLGSGTFGMVKLWHNEVTKEKIALKTCHNVDPPMNEKSRERWRKEVEFLKRIKHPNIIQTRPLPDELAEHAYIETSLPALCMEYCEGGDLRKTLSTAENCCGLRETMIIRVCEDIANAIECLHSEKIVHRDLKPENIVICQGYLNRNVYKVIDLGYAKQLADHSGRYHSFVGTPYYLAPEILAGQKYTVKVDLWSYGILLYECCTGIRPFPFKNYKDVYGSMGSKDRDVIAVTYEEENDMLVDCVKLPEVNRLNCVFQRKFEELLRLLLDGKANRRGSCEETKRSWRDCVEEIKNTKVIEVFCIELYKLLVYELTADFSLQDLKANLEEDTGVPVENQEIFIHDGSDLNSLSTANTNLMAFMFNKFFNPKLELKYKHDLPSSLVKMLSVESPENVSKRTMRHAEVYKHSVFFIQKQIAINKCLSRGLKALVIRLLKWSRHEFTARSENLSRTVTELKSVAHFFEQSLHTDLRNYDNRILRNGVSRGLPDFEAWKRVEKEMDIHYLLKEAAEVFKKKSELQNKITAMKNHDSVIKTPDVSKTQLNQRALELQRKYEQVKMTQDKSGWKDNINVVRETIKMILKEVEKTNEEFYRYLSELFMLRQELECFIPCLKNLEIKTVGLHKKLQEWQQERQEQIWQLFSTSKDEEKTVDKDDKYSQTEEILVSNSRRRSSGLELFKQSQARLSSMKETLKNAKDQQEIFRNKLEDLDWSFCNISDSENT